MSDPGAPISYLTLKEGTGVVSADGVEVGNVQHVLFCDAPQVGEICEHEVRLTIDAAAAERLPEPSENPAVMEAGPDDLEEPALTDKLRRAWDLISGNY